MKIGELIINADLSQVLVELIKQLRANGIMLLEKTKETSTHIMVQCPYHNNGQERKPSAGIRKSDGILHCFACGAVHNLPETVSFCFGKTDDLLGKFGYEWLLKNFASTCIEERKDIDIDLQRDKTNKKDAARDNQFVTEEELDQYRYYHPYWKKRGITDENIIELFDLGFDKQTNCITFPVRDIKGNCLFVARRSVRTKYFTYPRGVEKPLYGVYELSQIGFNNISEVVVTESMLDALSFWQVDKYAVALNGLGDELQFQQLRKLPVRKIILATDMDEKGLAARKILKKKLQGKIVSEYFLPSGKKDANDCTREELRTLKDFL